MAQSFWNNPGNIGFGGFASKYGAVASGTSDTGHFVAVFPNLSTGWQATYDLATSKYNNGATTLNQLIAGQGGWTPGNYTAASNIANYMGISPNADLQLNNPSNLQSFGNALARQEGSTYAIGTAPLGSGGTPTSGPLTTSPDNTQGIQPNTPNSAAAGTGVNSPLNPNQTSQPGGMGSQLWEEGGGVQVTTKLSEQQAASAKLLSDTATKNTATLTQSNQNIANQQSGATLGVIQGVTDLFQRSLLGLVGIAILAGVVWYFVRGSSVMPKAVSVPA